MANTKITSRVIADNAVTSSAIADGAITASKIASDAIDIVADTTPQLGGDLDVNGNAIAGSTVQINGAGGELMISATENGPVALRYDNNLKLTTKSDGVDITGELQSDSLDVDGDADISGTIALGNLTIAGAQGTDGQVLTSTGSGIAWEDAAGGVAGIVSSADATAITIDSNETVDITTGLLSTNGAFYYGSPSVAQVSANRNPTTGAIPNASNSSAYLNLNTPAGSSSMEFVLGDAVNTQPSTKMTILGNGNVGIGTTSPVAPLTINDKATISFNVNDFALGHHLYYDSVSDRWERLSSSAGSALYQTAGMMTFYRTSAGGSTGDAVTPSESMRITSNGQLLVGTSSNASGTRVHIDGGSSNLGQLGLRNSSATSGNHWRMGQNSDSHYIHYNQSGTGVYILNGGTAWSGNSDETIKENIVELTGVLDKVRNFRCVEYNLISDETNSKKIGFIAQDWQEDYSQVISQDENGKLGMAYTETIPVLLKAIQEQQALIEAQATTITDLTNRIEALENS